MMSDMSKLDWRRARTFKEREAINDPHPGRLERRADRYLAVVNKRRADAKAKKRAGVSRSEQ